MSVKSIQRYDVALHEWMSSVTVGKDEMGVNGRQNVQIDVQIKKINFKQLLGNVRPNDTDVSPVCYLTQTDEAT